MWAEATEDAGPERYAGIRIPVLQLVGGDSSALFTDGTWALDRLLPNGRVVVIPGAKHAAHHSHPERFVQEVRSFLEKPSGHGQPPARGRSADRGRPADDGREPGDLPFEHD